MKEVILKTVTKYAALFAASAVAAAAIISQAAHAESIATSAAKSPVTISEIWARPSVPGGNVSAAYMQIKSSAPVKLIKVDAPVAGNVEIHNMNMKDGVMEMKAVDAIDVSANKMVELKPGGYHVMLMMLSKSINKGDNVGLKLTFEGADKKTFTMDVVARADEKGSSKTDAKSTSNAQEKNSAFHNH